MIKNVRLLLVLAIVLLSATVIFGQSKRIDEREYRASVTQSTNNLKGKSYRSTTITENFTDLNSKAVKTSKRIYEILPPERIRWIIESDGERKENIQIGQRRFVKINDGEWTEDKGSMFGNGSGGGGGQIGSVSYKVQENITLNGRAVRLFERSQKINDIVSGNKTRSEILTTRFWITKDGILMRMQIETTDVETKSLKRTTIDYEYDPNIKIEAPIK